MKRNIITPMAINERFLWAADFLNIQPNDNILEIGCGAGILVEQMADKLDTGKITAIDKSEPMIKMATKRNSRFTSSRRVNFKVIEFSKFKAAKGTFDKIVAFNVNFFWKNAQHELEIIKEILKPNGYVYIFYQLPYNIDLKATEPIIEKLKTYSFDIADIVLKELKLASAFCIKSKPAKID